MRALSDAGLHVVVLHIPRNPQSPDPAASIENVELVAIPADFGASGPGRFLSLHRSLSRFLEQFRASAVHASDLFVLPALAGYAARHRAPLSFDSRELYTHTVGTIGKPWSRLVWHLVQRRYLPHVDTTFTVSDGIADFLHDRYGIRRPIVIPNVPLSPARDDGPEVRSSLNLPTDAFLAVHTGDVRARRGCETAVEAVALMPPNQNGHLVFVGDGPLRQALKDLAAAKNIVGRVHFVDAVRPDDVTTFIRSADIGLVLIPDLCLSYHFALPNKLFECIGGGVPVVASDLPEMRRVVADHGVGLCVEPSNPATTATALEDLASDRAKLTELRKNCRNASAALSWETYRPVFVNPFLADSQQ